MRPHLLFGLYLLVCVLAVCWPGQAYIGGRIEPFILGLPFSFAWTILWVITTFLALVLYHRALQRRG